MSESTRDLALYHRLHARIEAGNPKWQPWATFHRLEERFNRVDGRVCHSLMLIVQGLVGSPPLDVAKLRQSHIFFIVLCAKAPR